VLQQISDNRSDKDFRLQIQAAPRSVVESVTFKAAHRDGDRIIPATAAVKWHERIRPSRRVVEYVEVPNVRVPHHLRG
jgi:hypothetical protein